MKLLVTGGAGFIGSHFIRYILNTYPAYQVVNLDALTYAGNLENLSDVENTQRYTFIKGDVCDRNLVFDLVRDTDAVIHYAAETHVDRSILDPAPFVRTNIMGTLTLLDAVREYGKRLHHISTDEVYGTLEPDDPPFHEGSAYNPLNPYSVTKAAADHMVRAYVNTHKVQATISNCSNNYGTHMFPEKFMPLFIANLRDGKKVPVYGDGLQRRDWIHATDHARGVDAILHRGEIGHTYCLGGGGDVTNLEIVSKLLKLCGRDESHIEYVKDRPGHDRRYAISYDKARDQLGWEPTVSLEDGLQEMVDWYAQNQAWIDRCRDGSYQEYYEKNYAMKV